MFCVKSVKSESAENKPLSFSSQSIAHKVVTRTAFVPSIYIILSLILKKVQCGTVEYSAIQWPVQCCSVGAYSWVQCCSVGAYSGVQWDTVALYSGCTVV